MAEADGGDRFCYLRISIAGAEPETVVISLYSKQCPKTCRNFEQICSSTATAKKDNSKPEPTYRGTEFHRVMPGFMVQGGDFENFDGTGGYSHDGGTFEDESFVVQHDREGVVSMANRGPNTNTSQFFITLAKTPHLNGKHVAFGQVVEGMSTVRRIAHVETEGTRPVPMQRVIIIDCGLGKGSIAKYTSSDESSDASRKHKKNFKKKKTKKRRKQHKDDSSSASSDGSSRKRKKRSRSEKRHSRKHRRHSKESSKKRHKKDR